MVTSDTDNKAVGHFFIRIDEHRDLGSVCKHLLKTSSEIDQIRTFLVNEYLVMRVNGNLDEIVDLDIFRFCLG